MYNGFVTVAAAIPSVKVGDCFFNTRQIEQFVAKAEQQGVEIIVFPELCITGYTCQDLFRQTTLIEQTENSVIALKKFTRDMHIVCIVGLPVVAGNLLLNCAAIIQSGCLLALIPKTYLPNYNEFYEKRWFASSRDLCPMEICFANSRIMITPEPTLLQTSNDVYVGVEICEDVWAPTPPSNRLALAGADLIFNLSASDELIGKHQYVLQLLSQQSARTITGYVYSSCGFGESTQDVVYGGNALVFENGKLLASSERFSLKSQLVINQIDIEKLRSERRHNSTYVNAQRNHSARIVELMKAVDGPFVWQREIDPLPFVPKTDDMAASCDEIFNIQVCGLTKRLVHIHCQTVVVGISGGLDSTLALLVCVKTFDKLGWKRTGIIGVTMPGFGTTSRTYNNAMNLMHQLGITIREVNISDAVIQHFKDIGHDPNKHDVTYENSQARERTQILMDLSNELGGIVIGTGDLSELALGWATYNGDHMSMYGVNVSIPKTLIRHLVCHAANYEMDDASREILLDIVETPISPELIPADEKGNIKQKTEDLVGPYELHDFFLYYFLRFGFTPQKIFFLAQQAFKDQYDHVTIQKWLTVFIQRFFSHQFKRSCLPDGPKVGSVSLSPRGDWRMPSDADSTIWINAIDTIK